MVDDMACPDGKLLPSAVATGWSTWGLGRSTAIFTTESTKPPPNDVTIRNTARRARWLTSTYTTPTAITPASTGGLPNRLTPFRNETKPGWPLTRSLSELAVRESKRVTGPSTRDRQQQGGEGHSDQHEGEGEQCDAQAVTLHRVGAPSNGVGEAHLHEPDLMST